MSPSTRRPCRFRTGGGLGPCSPCGEIDPVDLLSQSQSTQPRLKGVHGADPGCLPSYRDTPQKPAGRIKEEVEVRSLLLAPGTCSPGFYPDLRQTRPGLLSRLGRTPSTCLSAARGLLPRCIRPTTAVLSCITSTRASLVPAPAKRLPSPGKQGLWWCTPPPPLQRADSTRVGHCPPDRGFDTTEPLTPRHLRASLPRKTLG